MTTIVRNAEQDRQGNLATLPQLATQVNEAHRMVEISARSAVEFAVAAGKALIDAKEQVEHGEWLAWLAANCPDVTPRTSQGYMRVARNWETLSSNTKRVSHLTLRGALELLAEPKPEPNTTRVSHLTEPEPSPDGLDARLATTLTEAEANGFVLPGPGERVLGFVGNAMIELITSQDPDFIHYAVSCIDQTDEFPNGWEESGKLPVRRDAVADFLAPSLESLGATLAEVTWTESDPCEPPPGMFWRSGSAAELQVC